MELEDDEAGLFAQLDGVFDDVNEEVADYSNKTDLQLLTMFNDLTEQLKDDLQEAWKKNPKKQASRDVHSLRYALQIELRNRGVPV